MTQRLVTIATFGTRDEADMAVAVLESQGVRAFQEHGNTIGMFSYLSNAVGGVKVQVAEADVELAREILSTPARASVAEGSGVVCPHCGVALRADDSRCEFCSSPLSPLGERADSTELPVLLDGDLEVLPSQSDQLARRAWVAAVLGIFIIFPVVTVYSICLLLSSRLTFAQLSPRGRRCFYAAGVLNALLILANLLIFRSLYYH